MGKQNNLKLFLGVALGLVLALGGMLYYILKVDLLGGHKYLKNATRAFENVDIRALEHGVKYVSAETYEGALYGLGVVHARDRLW